MKLVGSRLYISGSFSSVGGQSRGRMASLNPTTGPLTTALNPAFTGANHGRRTPAPTVVRVAAEAGSVLRRVHEAARIVLELRGPRNVVGCSDAKAVDADFPRGHRVLFSVTFFAFVGQFTRAVQAHVYARGRVLDLDGPASFGLGGQ